MWGGVGGGGVGGGWGWGGVGGGGGGCMVDPSGPRPTIVHFQCII